MAGKEGSELNLKEFESLWKETVMDRHERFRSWIKKDDDRYFEVCFINFSLGTIDY